MKYTFVKNMKIHEKLRTIRISMGYTQDYVANKLFIDPVNYGRIERGQSKITIDRLTKISEILDFDVSEIFSKESFEQQNNTELLLKIYETELKILDKLNKLNN